MIRSPNLGASGSPEGLDEPVPPLGETLEVHQERSDTDVRKDPNLGFWAELRRAPALVKYGEVALIASWLAGLGLGFVETGTGEGPMGLCVLLGAWTCPTGLPWENVVSLALTFVFFGALVATVVGGWLWSRKPEELTKDLL